MTEEGARLKGRSGVLRSSSTPYRYTWDDYPGGKAILLTESRVAVLGSVGKDKRGYIAWAPLPDRDPEAERALGLLP